jgi:competence protein ComEA
MKKTFLSIAFGVVCGLLGAGIVFLASRPPRGSMILLSPPPTPRFWVINISGAVVHPGVYELTTGSRVRDAVQAAGGLSSDASVSGTNLAALLVDGQSIVIPDSTSLTPLPAERGDSLSITIAPALKQGASANTASASLINLNTATLDELDELPDIGPVTAQSIIDYRTANGAFVTIEDIKKVPGIGQVMFDKIKDLITVGP